MRVIRHHWGVVARHVLRKRNSGVSSPSTLLQPQLCCFEHNHSRLTPAVLFSARLFVSHPSCVVSGLTTRSAPLPAFFFRAWPLDLQPHRVFSGPSTPLPPRFEHNCLSLALFMSFRAQLLAFRPLCTVSSAIVRPSHLRTLSGATACLSPAPFPFNPKHSPFMPSVSLQARALLYPSRSLSRIGQNPESFGPRQVRSVGGRMSWELKVKQTSNSTSPQPCLVALI